MTLKYINDSYLISFKSLNSETTIIYSLEVACLRGWLSE